MVQPAHRRNRAAAFVPALCRACPRPPLARVRAARDNSAMDPFRSALESTENRAEPAYSDGRQSERALLVQRGTCRLLAAHGFSPVTELTLATGCRADIAALGPKGDIWIVEIKSSIEDFRADRKWRGYLDFCDSFFFASHAGVPADIFPADAGFILADAHGGEIVRDLPHAALAPARRKATTLRIAQAAAARLHRLADPGFSGGVPC